MYDHRKLGRELGLFDSDPLIGAGLPYWLPAGAAIRHALESYIAEVERRAGYQQVYSPVLGKRELYEISGHWAKYHDDMYPPMDMGGEQLVLRPSICPHHALMYRSRSHSYRELPLRYSELGGQYRAELSGAIGGLSRVRAMQLNDAHIFCRLDQVAGEAESALRLINQAYADMGISASRYVLALPSEDAEFNSPASKYVGDAGSWAQAVELLREVLKNAGIDYEDAPGDAAFYGPKIDIQLEDSAGREFSLSTVQIDFHQPERFGLEYVGADGNKHRPVMVHRAIVGSIERAVAQLIEVHGGGVPGLARAGATRRTPDLGRRGGARRPGGPESLGSRSPSRDRARGRGRSRCSDPREPARAVPGGDRRPRGRRRRAGHPRAGRPPPRSRPDRRGPRPDPTGGGAPGHRNPRRRGKLSVRTPARGAL